MRRRGFGTRFDRAGALLLVLGSLALLPGCRNREASPRLPPRLAERVGLPAHRRDTTLVPVHATGITRAWSTVRLRERQIGLDLSNGRLDRLPSLCGEISRGVSVIEAGIGERARKPRRLPGEAARVRTLASGLADLARSDEQDLAQSRYEELRVELWHFGHALGDSALGRR